MISGYKKTCRVSPSGSTRDRKLQSPTEIGCGFLVCVTSMRSNEVEVQQASVNTGVRRECLQTWDLSDKIKPACLEDRGPLKTGIRYPRLDNLHITCHTASCGHHTCTVSLFSKHMASPIEEVDAQPTKQNVRLQSISKDKRYSRRHRSNVLSKSLNTYNKNNTTRPGQPPTTRPDGVFLETWKLLCSVANSLQIVEERLEGQARLLIP